MNEKKDIKLSALKKVFPDSNPHEELLVLAHDIVEKGSKKQLSYEDMETLTQYIQILLKQRKFI